MKTEKKVFTKNGTLFSPNSSGDLRSNEHKSQILGGGGGGGCRCRSYSNYWVGIQSNYWGDIFPPSPPGFGTPACNTFLPTDNIVFDNAYIFFMKKLLKCMVCFACVSLYFVYRQA